MIGFIKKLFKKEEVYVEPKPELHVKMGTVEIRISGLYMDDAVSVAHSFLTKVKVPEVDYVY